ncbi:MAG: hypothetical protein JXA73_08905 [Acidobacteria bacterium]|nr:hypothetical protein [Acidobacteriota bacterium]
MEFRLLYEGPLRAERQNYGGLTGRARDKHELRKCFHPQLKELWSQHPDLRRQTESKYFVGANESGVKQIFPYVNSSATNPQVKTWVEHIADDHQRCGGRFVPLVTKSGGFTCSLEILFLRRDNPGNIIASGGDIDNRIKVLFDGLRMPNTTRELGGLSIDPDENPFYCLLEDDSLITKVSITTDRLLSPQTSCNKIHDVFLEICVTVICPGLIFTGNRLV